MPVCLELVNAVLEQDWVPQHVVVSELPEVYIFQIITTLAEAWSCTVSDTKAHDCGRLNLATRPRGYI